MTDLSDVNMEGVQPLSESQELPVGTYLVRVEDTEKKETKEKFGDDGQKLPPNFYLQFAMKAYGGDHDGQTEFVRLNLWNTNQQAVNIAKSELKSIQQATGVVSANSDHYHSKWLVMEVKAGRDATKKFRNYSQAPAELLAQFAHVPPVPAKAPSAAPAAAQQQADGPRPGSGAQAAAAAASTGAASALPDWAKKKTA